MPDDFRERLRRLHEDIVQQGRRVEAVVELAFEAVFDADADKARRVIAEDAEIDRVDVEIERAAVQLLAIGEKEARQLRMVLTIVKVNNELERIADLATDVAEQVVLTHGLDESLPATLRVMANSAVGMVRDANRAMRDLDENLARVVLASDDLVDEFRAKLLREVQENLAAGRCSVDFAQAMWQIATSIERIGDHTTNICEQVIYVETGQIVRHSSSGWSEPMSIDPD